MLRADLDRWPLGFLYYSPRLIALFTIIGGASQSPLSVYPIPPVILWYIESASSVAACRPSPYERDGERTCGCFSGYVCQSGPPRVAV
ncbi:hypothetical protein BD309DRAFT_973724 [Dichomitus squalens]|nr:hypothetical protein BD309DRAFT_973724 [Dichomitus squalens]